MSYEALASSAPNSASNDIVVPDVVSNTCATELAPHDVPQFGLGAAPFEAASVYAGRLSGPEMVSCLQAKACAPPWIPRIQGWLLLGLLVFVALCSNRRAATVCAVGMQLHWHQGRRSVQPVEEILQLLMVLATSCVIAVPLAMSIVGAVWLVGFPAQAAGLFGAAAVLLFGIILLQHTLCAVPKHI